MRILSQDGKIDLPYENFSLSITQDNCIVAARDVVARPTEMLIGVVAKYSTEAKARKAMEMLREAYCGVIYLKHADYEVDNIDLAQELEEKIKEEMSKPHFLEVTPKNPVVECKVFQFPSDDEVEV